MAHQLGVVGHQTAYVDLTIYRIRMPSISKNHGRIADFRSRLGNMNNSTTLYVIHAVVCNTYLYFFVFVWGAKQ